MATKYLLDQNLKVTGDLKINVLINVTGEVKGIKPLSDLIGKKNIYEGDLSLDTLVISDLLGYTLSCIGNTTLVINTDYDKLIEEQILSAEKIFIKFLKLVNEQ